MYEKLVGSKAVAKPTGSYYIQQVVLQIDFTFPTLHAHVPVVCYEK